MNFACLRMLISTVLLFLPSLVIALDGAAIISRKKPTPCLDS